MKHSFALGVALLVSQAPLHAADPGPRDFQWHATLDTDGRSGLVRVPLPADALGRLQSGATADVRVFDGAGKPVPFAITTPPPAASAPRTTPGLPVLPLHSTEPGQALPTGAVQVKVDSGSAGQSVWVQLGGTTTASGRRLPAALVDTRALKEPIAALRVQGTLPPNAPVRLRASSSADLEHWTPVPLQGRIYRFEGNGAPANDRLELREPLRLQDRYLRLDWAGQEGVVIHSVTGVIAATTPPPERPAVTLPAPRSDATGALEWELPFRTRIAQLDIGTASANTLLPLRILGRNQVSEPWRALGQTVVYRLGPAGEESVNKPVPLYSASVRWLRVEATHGTRMLGVPLAVRALFDPVEVVFVAGERGPYQLAAGREATLEAALPLAMLAATTTSRIADLPVARVREARSVPQAARPDWMPHGLDTRTAGLWAVLTLGVLLLGAVAFSLLRQLKRDAGPPA
ncbi:MAG: hypothetical protein K0S57_770 [Ramlibacter sp.]|nr:hypothetical protein [Ramlibacter sp.]